MKYVNLLLKMIHSIMRTDQCLSNKMRHIPKQGLRTYAEEIVFTAWSKIFSHSQIFRYGQSIFCVPYRQNFSDSLIYAFIGFHSPCYEPSMVCHKKTILKLAILIIVKTVADKILSNNFKSIMLFLGYIFEK